MLEMPSFNCPPTTSVVNVLAAAELASARHKHQVRKDGSPYYNHCRVVASYAAMLAAEVGEDEIGVSVCQAAGYLHDLLEDTNSDFEDIVRASGAEVATLVSWLSDDKRLPSLARHALYCKRLAKAPPRARLVKVADILHNADDARLYILDSFGVPDAASRVASMVRWASKSLDLMRAIWSAPLAAAPTYDACVAALTGLVENPTASWDLLAAKSSVFPAEHAG